MACPAGAMTKSHEMQSMQFNSPPIITSQMSDVEQSTSDSGKTIFFKNS